MDSPICETCQHLKIIGGDWVDYGSTRAQLPDDWECGAEWTDAENALPDMTEDLFLGKVRICPHYLELPHCPKHPNNYVDSKYGCGACEEELFQRQETSNDWEDR